MTNERPPALESSRTSEQRTQRRTWIVLGVIVVAITVLLSGFAAVLLVPGREPANRPPTASFGLSPASGDVTTTFVADASASSDPEDAASIQVRWDWEDDGTWDAGWSTTRTATHVYSSPRTYTIRLEVRDTAGMTATATREVLVATPPDTPPIVVITSPANGAILTASAVTVIGTAADDRNVTRVEVSTDGATWLLAIGLTSWFADLTLPGGPATIRARVTDTAGQTGSTAVSITVDLRELRLGVILSTSGALSVFGLSNERAIRLAIEEINSAGGVFGKPVVAFYEDDQTRTDVAAALASSLITDRNVDVIVGSLASGVCWTILGQAKAAGVFEISGACTSPLFSNASQTGGWFARTSPSDALQGVVAAHHSYNNLSLRAVAVIAMNNAYGRGVGDTFSARFAQYGGTVTTVHYVDEFQTSYAADLAAVMSTNPEAVYLAAWPSVGEIVIREWYQNPSWRAVRWILTEGLLDQSGFIDPLVNGGIVPASVVQTFLGTAPAAYMGVTAPGFPAWAAAYQSRWGVAPGLFDANFYDAVYLIALAAQASGLDTGAGVQGRIREVATPLGTAIAPGEWARALNELTAAREVDYDGASGAVNLLPNGDSYGAYLIWGVDSSNRIVVREVYPEVLVETLLP